MSSAELPFTELPAAEFGFPGPLRDRLVAAIVDGTKKSTSSLAQTYSAYDPLPAVGDQARLIDSRSATVGIVTTTAAAVVPLRLVDLHHAVDEGEGYASVAEWRAGHLRFWTSPEHVAEYGEIAVTGDTLVVLERFRFAPSDRTGTELTC